ncbi:MAG: hypothetical protein HOJ48_13455 [Desulfobacula sp.]|nr:hypothetical protein [Desulfobacula sp.]
MTKKRFLGIAFFLLLFTTGCSRTGGIPINNSIVVQTPSNVSNISKVENMPNNPNITLCPSFPIGKNEKFYNITGFVLSGTRPNSTIYLTPTISTAFTISLQVPRECLVYWQAKITDNQSFRFNQIPAGKYVLFVKGSSYKGRHGPPLPYEKNDQGYVINVSFHGGDSEYMMSAFEINKK